ncbi:head completion adaptor [Caudoviricetes sp.]|nr:head completion adaptor [Caudoviricetes sp.]
MPKMTLLELVKDILNDLDGDPVNSINDTVEAQQVSQIIKTTFYNIVDGKEYPHKNELFQLEALADVNRPNYLKIPETQENVQWVKYNVRTITDTKDKYLNLQYKTPQEFLALTDIRDSSATNVQVVSDFSGIPLNILDDKAPQYYTSFDDVYIVFDSFDSGIDTTLQQSKNSCFGKRTLTFTISDTFTPDLPVQMFSYLLNEAKSTAFLILKQTANAKAEQHSVSQRRRMSQDAWKVQNGITYPDYGRKSSPKISSKDLPPRG